MDGSVREMLERLRGAREPAAVFGPLSTVEALRRAYRRAAMRCHPDRFPADGERAREAFVRLTHWYEAALRDLEAGNGGPAAETVRLRHGDQVYEVQGRVAFSGDFADVHRARHGDEVVALKVARRGADGDLLLAERAALRRIARRVAPRLAPYFPRLLDGFAYADGAEGAGPGGGGRAASVLSWVGGAYTLEELRREFATGLDPRDVAWIWRRLLVALGAAHRAGVVHGAVLPPHICVLPAAHGLVLIGWTCAVEPGHPVPAVSTAYEAWYPREVLAREPASPATDLAMAARCMAALLPPGAPGASGAAGALERFARGCGLPAPRQRPQDAWELLRELDALLARLWGRRNFHPFAVAAPCPR